jgi:hypothetical protein
MCATPTLRFFGSPQMEVQDGWFGWSDKDKRQLALLLCVKFTNTRDKHFSIALFRTSSSRCEVQCYRQTGARKHSWPNRVARLNVARTRLPCHISSNSCYQYHCTAWILRSPKRAFARKWPFPIRHHGEVSRIAISNRPIQHRRPFNSCADLAKSDTAGAFSLQSGLTG